MLGFVMGIAFRGVQDTAHITGLNWRLMLGSAGVSLNNLHYCHCQDINGVSSLGSSFCCYESSEPRSAMFVS